MENASKALIMAGGVILTILVISLLIFGWSRFTHFYSQDEELKKIDDIAKFNEQFTAYDRTVSGYELVSLANRVADYNFRYSNANGATNDEKYNPITLEIIWNEVPPEKKNNLSYDGTIRLFIENVIQQSEVSNRIKSILDDIAITERFLGGADTAARVAKNIGIIDLEMASLNYYDKELSLLKGVERTNLENLCTQNYNSAAKKNLSSYLDVYSEIRSSDRILEYYEYYQFKRAKFDCNGISYDTQGRVSAISFSYTGKIE